MRSTQRLSSRVVIATLGALSIGAFWIPATSAPAAAQPTAHSSACTAAKQLVVDVTQNVRNHPLLPARDGHMWAKFSYTQHLRIWSVGGNRYCVRKEYEGTWESVAGLSPGLTGTISDGLTGTFEGTEQLLWVGTLDRTAPTSGHLGEVDAACTDVDVCADDSYQIVNTFYFPRTQHCRGEVATLEVDGGEHGHISLRIGQRSNQIEATGDITG